MGEHRVQAQKTGFRGAEAIGVGNQVISPDQGFERLIIDAVR